MKKHKVLTLVFCGLLLFSTNPLNAQDTDKQTVGVPVRLEKTFGGYKFYQHDQRLTIRQLNNAVATNQFAYREIESARQTYYLALILSGLGGAMIGNPVGIALRGGEPNWSLAAVGGGLVFVSIVPLNRRINRKIKNGVEIYNSGLETSTSSNKSIVTIGLTTNGLGIIVKLR